MAQNMSPVVLEARVEIIAYNTREPIRSYKPPVDAQQTGKEEPRDGSSE